MKEVRIAHSILETMTDTEDYIGKKLKEAGFTSQSKISQFQDFNTNELVLWQKE